MSQSPSIRPTPIGIPNPELLLAPLTTQEAVPSSRIEGTRGTLVEVLRHEAGEQMEEERARLDIHEIVNYRRALQAAEATLRSRPFNLNLLLKLQGMLLEGVRSRDGAGADSDPCRTTLDLLGPVSRKPAMPRLIQAAGADPRMLDTPQLWS